MIPIQLIRMVSRQYDTLQRSSPPARPHYKPET